MLSGDLKISDENFTEIKESLMTHLNECVAEGLTNEELYAIVLNDIAPVMQIVESVMSREGKDRGTVNERDQQFLDSYCEYLDEVAEDTNDSEGVE